MKSDGNGPIETRLAHLEDELEQLRAEVEQCKQTNWRAIVGSHQGSQTFDEIVRAIHKHREDDYAQARAMKRKRQPTRKPVVTKD